MEQIHGAGSRAARSALRMLCSLALIATAAAIAAGCGSDAGAKDGPVQIGFTTGRDPQGTQEKIFAECTKKSGGRYYIDPIYMPPTVDGQREQLIRRLAGKDPSMDILSIDVIWTAEFSEANWIFDLTDRIEPIKAEFVPAALNTVKWKNKMWALPVGTNVAMLYYRTDIIKTPPKTWEEMVTMAKAAQKDNPDMAGFLWQANEYEGLTVDAMEFILAANGKVLSEDGKESILDEGDGAEHAFTFMRSLVEEGVTPKSVLTFQEEESRQAFQQGKGVFLRNWPYVYSLAAGPDSKIVGKYDAIPLPPFEGRTSAGVLGGVNYAISRFSDAPDLAWEAASCIGSAQANKTKMIEKGELSAREATYVDPDVLEKIPFAPIARKALDTAYPRPTTPYYNDATYSINHIAHEVTAGQIEPAEAVKELDEQLQRAIEGQGDL